MIRLSKLEEQIMDTLWDFKRAFPKVIMVHMALEDIPYNTVLSAIRKLEKDGHIGFLKYGKSHEYFPILKRDEYGRSLFNKLYRDVLAKSNVGLLSYFMKEENVNIEELESLVQKLKDLEK